ncbi:MAG: prolyl oligopeptidase family serine peptidase [Holosporaceae bacterium]
MNRWVVLFFILIGLALAGSTQLRKGALLLSDKEQKDYKRYLESCAHEQEQIRRAQLYDMPEGVDFLDNTQRILNSAYMANNPQVKEEMLKTDRRFFVYRYPSDGLQIAGYISFVPKAENTKTIFIVRGGNRSFGLPHPGHRNRTMGNHTYIGTTLRDSINPGRDEFGGKDVNDVINLVKFIPELRLKVGPQCTLKDQGFYLIGLSRGGMEMMLALARSPWLQSRVKKVISVVGMLDMHETLKWRPDMVSMFRTDFRLTPFNQKDWIKKRNPIDHVHKIRKDLPILIIQAGQDSRVNLAQGKNMLQKLTALGHKVTYWEHKDKGHAFEGVDSTLEAWLDQ